MGKSASLSYGRKSQWGANCRCVRWAEVRRQRGPGCRALLVVVRKEATVEVLVKTEHKVGQEKKMRTDLP